MQERQYDDYFITKEGAGDTPQGLLQGTNKVVLHKLNWRVPVAVAKFVRTTIEQEASVPVNLFRLENVYLSQTAGLALLHGYSLGQLFDDTFFEFSGVTFPMLLTVFCSTISIFKPPLFMEQLMLASIVTSKPFNKEAVRASLFKKAFPIFN